MTSMALNKASLLGAEELRPAGGGLALPGTIMVQVVAGDREDALLPALDLAGRSGAGLIAIGAEGFKSAWPDAYGIVDGALMADLLRQLRARLADARARFEEATRDRDVNARWIVEETEPRDALVGHACAADWIVAVRPPRHADPTVFAAPAALLMDSGLPVLLSPSRFVPLKARKVVIGWKNTRESRRAVAAAMPLLAAAEEVVAVEILTGAPDGDTEGLSLKELCDRLLARGCRAHWHCRQAHGDDVAGALKDVMVEHEADLLVVGGYGHSRIQERILGGLTRTLLENFPFWTLLAH